MLLRCKNIPPNEIPRIFARGISTKCIAERRYDIEIYFRFDRVSIKCRPYKSHPVIAPRDAVEIKLFLERTNSFGIFYEKES